MIDLYDFCTALNEASLPTDIINPSASGTAANIILQTWKVKHGQRFITNFVLGEMGAGLPYSIGAAMATGKRIIHVEGDGGFQLNIQELETIRRLNLPIIMFIISNNGYASIRSSQMSAFGRVTGADNTSGVTLPSLWSVAEAYEIDWYEIWDADQVNLELDMPCLIEVNTYPAQQYRHRVKSKLVNGVMTTAPMDEVN
jgi:acetolactate synthase-1/2/3 large subunit